MPVPTFVRAMAPAAPLVIVPPKSPEPLPEPVTSVAVPEPLFLAVTWPSPESAPITVPPDRPSQRFRMPPASMRTSDVCGMAPTTRAATSP